MTFSIARSRAAFLALLHSVAKFADHDVDGAHRVIVAGDRDVHEIRVAVGVDEADRRNTKRSRFEERILLAIGINDNERARSLRHGANAAEVSLDLLALAKKLRFHFLRVVFEVAALDNPVQFVEALQALANGAEIGERATEPALRDERHLHVSRILLNGTARLPLGSDETDILAVTDGLLNEALGEKEAFDRFTHIENVNLVADAVDVRRHLRIPVAATLTEMNTCFDKFLNERSHVCSPATPTQRGGDPPVQGRLWMTANRLRKPRCHRCAG